MSVNSSAPKLVLCGSPGTPCPGRKLFKGAPAEIGYPFHASVTEGSK